MSRGIRLGVLTPSSNTALEPLTSALVAEVPGCSAHFSRFRVTEIALSAQALGQFDDSSILAAGLRISTMFSETSLDVIAWSGTSSGWLGFDADRRLVEGIKARTGIPATTAVMALNELLVLRGIGKLGLVTPYTADVQERIVRNYEALGIQVVAERHSGIRVNYDFALVEPDRLQASMEEVAAAGPDAIATFCTNLRAAPLAAGFEARTGVPLLDTVSTTVWGALRAIGEDPQRLRNWGQFFAWR